MMDREINKYTHTNTLAETPDLYQSQKEKKKQNKNYFTYSRNA